jgi:ribosomal-protein-alanine N-acetyltransferase
MFVQGFEMVYLDVSVRLMRRSDVLRVLDIENESFEVPWSEKDFLICLKDRKCLGLVALYEDLVVGFVVYELERERFRILNLAVVRDFRRCDVGRRLVDKLIEKLRVQRRSEIELYVRERNLGAQLFFRDLGFEATGVIRDYYDESPEDAYRMCYVLGGRASNRVSEHLD